MDFHIEYLWQVMMQTHKTRLWRTVLVPIFSMNLLLLPSLFVLVKGYFSFDLVPFSLVNGVIMTSGLMLNIFIHNQLSGTVKTWVTYSLMAFVTAGFSVMGVISILIDHPLLLLYSLEVVASYTLIVFIVMMAFSRFSCGLFDYQRMVEKEKEEKETEKQLREEMERQMHSSKINPHFLFNSLNMMVALLDDKEKSEEILIGLSELLRFNLDASKKTLIPLSEEIDSIRKYLFIQKQRFGKRLSYEIRGDSAANIPPLLLQPLVENSIKHNLDTGDSIEITISIEESDEALKIGIRDSMAQMTPEMIGRGTGLAVTQKRVQLAGGVFKVVNGGIELCLPKR